MGNPILKVEKEAAREARLQIAVELAASNQPLSALQVEMLDAICQVDPVVREILKAYKQEVVVVS